MELPRAEFQRGREIHLKQCAPKRAPHSASPRAPSHDGRRAQPTRAPCTVVFPSLAETLALKTVPYGAVITTYASPNYNSKKIHGTVEKLIEHLGYDEVRCSPSPHCEFPAREFPGT